jgi:flap endonuclease-1
MFYRTIRMMDNGIKPVFVFDGKPPDLKAITVRPDRPAVTP